MLLEKKLKVAACLRNIRFYIFCILVAFVAISKAAIEITFGLMLFLWLIENILVNKWRIGRYFPKTKLNLPIAIFMVVLFLSVFNSVVFHLSLRKFFSKWVQYIMIYFFTVDTLDSKKKLKTVLWLLSAALTLVLLDGLWQWFAGKDLFYSNVLDGDRWLTSCYAGLSAFGSVIILAAPVVISFLFVFSNKIIVGYRLLLIGLVFVCLLLSYSATSWIALSFSSILGMFLHRGKKNIRYTCFFWLVFLLIISVFPIFRYRILSLKEHQIVNQTGRIQIWKQNLKEITKNPILGKGICTTTVEIAKTYSKYPLVIRANPHSLYLLILLEVGLLGFLAYLWIMLRAFFMVLSTKKYFLSYGLLIGATAFLIVNIASTIWYERIQSLFWMILGLTAVVSKLKIPKESGLNQRKY